MGEKRSLLQRNDGFINYAEVFDYFLRSKWKPRTIIDLAEALGVKPQTIYNWKNNSTVPNERVVLDTIGKVFALSAIEIEALILATGKVPKPQQYSISEVIEYLQGFEQQLHHVQTPTLKQLPQSPTNPPEKTALQQRRPGGQKVRLASAQLLILWLLYLSIDGFVFRPKMAAALPSIDDPQLVLANAQQWKSLFHDAFDDNRHGWVVGTRGDSSASLVSEITDGRYVLTATALRAEGALAWDTQTLVPAVGNFYVTFDLQQLKGDPDNDAGIALRMRGNINHEDSYFVYLKQPSKRMVMRKLHKDLNTLSDIILSDIYRDLPNKFEIIAYDSYFWIYMNGTFVAKVFDDAIAEGTINFMMRLPLQGSTATYAYDNFEVRMPVQN
ncbi:helix-turn-helix domain-containing protein [Herpetosiphon geysericola]|uniref:HTH cro/C1-type domain-containing protein n=1 Tax=Herpetosiphon geysericola TaxID=70996 RepID=A0A0P6Y2Y0_9CHLR|nr:helix-turn-helix transcriptional regulator [Herpetosiphon geysericola]KPL90208.1 hypothetical protein SE18_08385 [Herpetosiphon geysericola]